MIRVAGAPIQITTNQPIYQHQLGGEVVKMKTWIEEMGDTTDECLTCGLSLEDVVDIEDGVCGVCLATR